MEVRSWQVLCLLILHLRKQPSLSRTLVSHFLQFLNKDCCPSVFILMVMCAVCLVALLALFALLYCGEGRRNNITSICSHLSGGTITITQEQSKQILEQHRDENTEKVSRHPNLQMYTNDGLFPDRLLIVGVRYGFWRHSRLWWFTQLFSKPKILK